MPIVTTTEMFKKAYAGGYAVGAFNVNNMEIVQGITEAAGELKAPVILQVSRAPAPTRTTIIWFIWSGPRRKTTPISRSPCIWITATALSCARTASTAASPPS